VMMIAGGIWIAVAARRTGIRKAPVPA